MSYELITEDGPAGQLATGKGYGELILFADKYGGKKLRDFVQNGKTQDPAALKAELEATLQGIHTNAPVKRTIKNMIQLLDKAKEIAIVSV